MPRNLLSAARLRADLAAAQTRAASTGANVRIGDGAGLMLVVRPNTEASWVLRASVGGARRDLTLGRWPAVTLQLARQLADRQRGEIAQGIDPMLRKREERAAAAKVVARDQTFRVLFEGWLEHVAHSDVYHGNIEAAFKKDVLPVIGATEPHLVTREQMTKILRAIEKRGSTVMLRRVRMWLRQVFEFAIDDERWPLVKASPVPEGMLKSYRQRKAGHFAAITNATEVAALMRAIRAIEDNFMIRAALLFSAHVFQRPTEVREARWSEIDLEGAKWTIPAERMKMDEEHWVPLSRQVVELLRSLRGVVGGEGYLFPGRKYGKSLSEATLNQRLNTLGFKGRHTPHGFRAMARTVGEEELKIEAKYLEKQLSHEVDQRLGGAYNRAEYWDERVRMMQRWSDWLDEQSASTT